MLLSPKTPHIVERRKMNFLSFQMSKTKTRSNMNKTNHVPISRNKKTENFNEQKVE